MTDLQDGQQTGQPSREQDRPEAGQPNQAMPEPYHTPADDRREHDPSGYWHPGPQGPQGGPPGGQEPPQVNLSPLPGGPDAPPPKKKRASFWTILFAVLLTASITFLATTGVWYGLFYDRLQPSPTEIDITPSRPTPTSEDPDQKGDDKLTITFNDGEGVEEALNKFTTVYNLLQDNYYQEKSDAELIEKMTEGLIGQMGSPYTFYLTPEYRQQSEESMSGEYVGIGASVMQQDDGAFAITDVMPGGPAEEAGLQVGDIFISIDGKDVSTFADVTELAMNVRGESGSTVRLVMRRAQSGKEETFELTRRAITTMSVRHRMVTEAIGYIHVTDFSYHVAENFENAVIDLMDKGAQHLVIDLRNNGGGYATECVNMLDVLLPPQDVVTVRGREDGQAYEHKWATTTAALVPDSMTYVILLNKYSASASELFSGVLRDLGKATLVGEKSFGKGVGTLTWDLEDKSAVQITTFEYYLPKGESINDIGLVPDFEVALSPEAELKPPSQLTLEEDAQLQKALEILEPRVK